MNYYQITAPLPSTEANTEILIARLSFIGFESFEEQSEIIIAYIPEKEFDKNELLDIDYCLECENSGKLKVELIVEKNWNEVWESNYPPVIIVDRIFVRASFHESMPSIDYEIVIQPKMAFGTAHHHTTSLMLELILENNFNSKKVLDIGCGTGVLAIMASMKGAKTVTAIDIDKWSYENTLENAKINNINNITAIEGGAESLSETDNYDVILANINKNILLRDMKNYAHALAENGYIYLSGFYVNDLSDIEVEAGKYGLKIVNNLENNNWVAAVLRR
ncbi:MAG: 50S ribosomal protein L11 methyltransferase [Bacteroidetes bacterium]|nr:50S ribosomal protein L11 methyltransferase [Bacteroidota bacterium]